MEILGLDLACYPVPTCNRSVLWLMCWPAAMLNPVHAHAACAQHHVLGIQACTIYCLLSGKQ